MRRVPALLLEGAALRCSDASPEIEFGPVVSSIHLSGEAVDRLEMLTSSSPLGRAARHVSELAQNTGFNQHYFRSGDVDTVHLVGRKAAPSEELRSTAVSKYPNNSMNM